MVVVVVVLPGADWRLSNADDLSADVDVACSADVDHGERRVVMDHPVERPLKLELTETRRSCAHPPSVILS